MSLTSPDAEPGTGAPAAPAAPQLVRSLTLLPATALNMVDMIGVGPFATLPLMVAAMGGARAVFGWVAGALLAISDGLIWAELGTAMPRAGGSYEYLSEIYGRKKLGRLLAFLFVFQLVVSAPVSMATGCVGLAGYASYLFPGLGRIFLRTNLQFQFIGAVNLPIEVSGATILAVAAAGLATVLVYRRISAVGQISKVLWIGVLATVGFVIFVGLSHFNRGLAFSPGWLHGGVSPFSAGFAGALLIALYDYWGYYNICFLAEEVADPARTIPRSMLLSIAAVAILYVAMNVGIMGVLPVNEITGMTAGTARNFVAAKAAQVVYGHWAGTLVSVFVIWTAFASVFALLAGYSRIPFAAARDGNFFSLFQKVDAKGKFPSYSVLLLGGLGAFFCLFQLRDLVAALVVIRITLLFLVQAVGAVVWRIAHPERRRPFRMWLYPLPVLITLAGFSLVLYDRRALLARALVFATIGVVIYLSRAAKRREWPFSAAAS